MLATLVAIGAGQVEVQAQQTATNGLTLATNTVAAHGGSTVSLNDSASMGLRLTEPADTNSLDYMVSKTKVHLSGPLVGPLKAKSASDFSHRVLRLFSPFSDEEPNMQPAATGPVSGRAWSTIAGWNPGGSAFQTESHHEPQGLRLISVSVAKQP
jgi:hypothetical protein